MGHLGAPTAIKAGLEEAIFMNSSGVLRLFFFSTPTKIHLKESITGWLL